jgi:hypothetical protein
VPGEGLFDFTGVVETKLRNVGLGPALRVEVGTRYTYDDLQPTSVDKIIVPPFLPATRRSSSSEWCSEHTNGQPSRRLPN